MRRTCVPSQRHSPAAASRTNLFQARPRTDPRIRTYLALPSLVAILPAVFMYAHPELTYSATFGCSALRGDRARSIALAVAVAALAVAPGCRLAKNSTAPPGRPDVAVDAAAPVATTTGGTAVADSPGVVALTSFHPDWLETAPDNSGCMDACAGLGHPDTWSRPYSFRDDLHGFVPMLKHDAHGMVNVNNALLLSAALAGSVAMRDDLDEEVRREVAQHPERWGTASNVLGRLGEVQYQVPVLLAVYGYSLREQDAELHELSASLISAYTLTGLTTTVIKGVSNTERPSKEWNDGNFGFPSFHVASSMSIAAVLDEYYGPKVGLPAIALAGLIGWSRIDERDHDLSDVVFGAAVGYLIGKSVAGQHRTGDGRVHVLPWTHPTEGTPGLQLNLEW